MKLHYEPDEPIRVQVVPLDAIAIIVDMTSCGAARGRCHMTLEECDCDACRLCKRVKERMKILNDPRGCLDCGTEWGVWEITILKKWRGQYGKKHGLLCNECLILAIEGYHTGGGVTAAVIKKIVRKDQPKRDILGGCFAIGSIMVMFLFLLWAMVMLRK